MTRVLALDSSQLQATVCLVENGQVVGAHTGSIDVAHSEALLAHLDELLRAAGRKLSDLDAFGIGIGPGSFTGIRIGCATVKALAQVTRKPVLPFSSLRATALSAHEGPAAVA